MSHPARILSGGVISFLIGVFVASWLRVPLIIMGGLALVGLFGIILRSRLLIVAIFLIAMAVGMYAMYGYEIPYHYQATREHSGAVYKKIYAARDWFLANLTYVIAEPHAAFIAGILVGSKSELPKDIIKDFQQTGTSHIIAVSGYNITIVAKALLAVALLVLSRKWAFWTTVSGLVLFMILTGAQASVVRATIMGISVLVARQAGRLPTPLHTLILAAGIMVAIDPPILRYDIGFQLSFLATFGILEVAPLLEQRMRWTKRLSVWGEALVMTMAANICVLPLILYYFKSFPLYFLPANLIVLPLIPLTMLIGFSAGVFARLPLLGDFVGYLARILSEVILGVIHFFAHLPGSSIAFSMGAWTTALAYFLLAIVFFYYQRRDHEQDN